MFLRHSVEEDKSFIILLQLFGRYSVRHLPDQSLEGKTGTSPDPYSVGYMGEDPHVQRFFSSARFPMIRPLPLFEESQGLVRLLAQVHIDKMNDSSALF